MSEMDNRWTNGMAGEKTEPEGEGEMGAEQQGCLNCQVRQRRTKRTLKVSRFVRACERCGGRMRN